MRKSLYLFGFISLFLCVGSLGIIYEGDSSALSYQDSVDVEFTFNPSISVTVSGDLVIENLAPGSSSDSNIIDVSVATNNISGYVLTATAGNTSHTNTDLTKSGIENKFSSVATNADLSSITTDNTWGYSFSNNAGSSWTNYSGLPLYTAETGKELVSVDTNTVTPIKFKIAAKASTNQPAGTYTNVINFIAVANPEPTLGPVGCTAGKICYQPNALSGVVGTMGEQDATDGNTTTLFASNFSRTGYGFAGWSDVYDYDTNANAHFYGPNEDITVPTGTTANGTSLYAVWVKSAGSMQSSSVSQICNSLTQAPTDGTANLSSVTALTDQRDHQTYAIAKLADGKCWTIENLRLADKDSNNNDINLSSTNTHNPSLPLTNIYDSSTTSNHLSPTSSVAYDATNAPEGWCSGNSSACDDQSRLRTDNTVLFTSNTASGYNATSDVYSYGNYYNWYSATAGHGKYGSSYDSSLASPGDICPYGWHLPTGTSSGEYYALNTAINAGSTSTSAGLRTYPANFVYSGRVNGSSVEYRNSYGHYWSASRYNSNNAYYLYFYSTSVTPGTGNNYKWLGRMVRCVAGV